MDFVNFFPSNDMGSNELVASLDADYDAVNDETFGAAIIEPSDDLEELSKVVSKIIFFN